MANYVTLAVHPVPDSGLRHRYLVHRRPCHGLGPADAALGVELDLRTSRADLRQLRDRGKESAASARAGGKSDPGELARTVRLSVRRDRARSQSPCAQRRVSRSSDGTSAE